MTRFFALLLAFLSIAAASLGATASSAQDPSSDPAEGPPPAAYVIRIEGALNAGHMALFQRAAASAKATDALLIVVLDTPGGAITRMTAFAESIDREVQDGLRIAGWVDGQAMSAGTWIAITCNSLYMKSRSTIGSATAVQIGPDGMRAAEEKIASAYRAWVRGWAEDHGRDPLLAQAMIDMTTEVRRVKIDGVEQLISGELWDDMVQRGDTPELINTVVRSDELWALTGTEAIDFGFADALAESVDEVMAKEGFAGMRSEQLDFTRAESWLAKVWEMRLLLLFLGLFFGYVELKVPGFGIPGILSLLCFGVMFAGQYLVGLADIPHIVLAVLGVVLVAVELFLVPGFIWPGLVGALCLIVGLLLSQVGPGVSLSDGWHREILFDASFQLAATAALALLAIWLFSKYLPDTPVLGRMVLAGGGGTSADALPEARDEDRSRARVGALGVAGTAMRPVGKVSLDGDSGGIDHEARAESGVIDKGQRVEVVEVQAGRLVVRLVSDGQPPQSDPAPSQNPASAEGDFA